MTRPRTGDRSTPGRGPMRWIAAGLLAAAVGLLAGGYLGIALALAVLFGTPRVIGRLSTRAERRDEVRQLRDAPQVVALLAACLASGAAPRAAVAAVAAAFDGPTARGLHEVERALRLGEPAERAFARLTPPALGQAIARSVETGAVLAESLPGVAADLRRRVRTSAEVAARSAGVRAVGPLAICFLPAFLLVGVVPVVVGLARGVLL